MRAIGIDVHRDFCEVAISEGGQLRSAGRVPSTPAELELLAASLARRRRGGPGDHRQRPGHRPHPGAARAPCRGGQRRELHAISDAKAKTDRRDARTLAKLLAAGMLEGTWLPDEETRALRRRLARRAQLVRAAPRALKNEIHATLYRNLKGAPAGERPLRRRRASAGWRSSSCPPTSARPSRAACACSTS